MEVPKPLAVPIYGDHCDWLGWSTASTIKRDDFAWTTKIFVCLHFVSTTQSSILWSESSPFLPNPNLSNSWIPMHIHHHSPFYPFSIRGFTNSPILVALKQGFLLIFVIIPKPKVICGSVLRNEGIAKVIRYGTHRLTSVQYLFHGHSRLVP